MSEGSTGLAAMLQDIQEQAAQLDRELTEIDLLVKQARAEAGRHELRRNQARDRLGTLEERRDVSISEYRDATTALATATGRAALMESQIDILEGKQRALGRFRDSLERISETLQADLAAIVDPVAGSFALGTGSVALAGTVPPAFARAILSAQEDLRRDIARAMHDGPAQSLTNIVLQAEIAHRLMDRDPRQAADEVAQLVRMVQHALEATKTFIFDVRPMVLDDLGLVPTLRRAALDRGRRAGIPIQFESLGQERRLAQEIESGLFRILDDAVVGYLTTQPPSITITLDWNEGGLRSVVRTLWPDTEPATTRSKTATAPEPGAPISGSRGRLGRRRADETEEMPAALAQMIQEQQDDVAAASQAAAEAVTDARSLPAAAWHDIEHRARTLGLGVTRSEMGRSITAVVTSPADHATAKA
jgi:two-component system sensor histidine kinase DegS